MQVHHDEGVANRIDPESCADARASTKSSRANHSASLAQDRCPHRQIQSARMCQLLPTCRLRFHMTGIRSSSFGSEAVRDVLV